MGHKNADADQFKAILAAEIIKALDRDGLSVRGAQGRTGIAAADFSRIRNAVRSQRQTAPENAVPPTHIARLSESSVNSKVNIFRVVK